MASAILRDELRCFICLNIYKDPVTLRCGHNFCWYCIDRLLKIQDRSGIYSCPECREEFQERPALLRNVTLHNVAERLRSTQRHREEVTRICCTYCVDSPVPAVRSCLHCEASLCEKHLKLHSKEAEHVLTDPSKSLDNRKCSVHKKILEYYCTECTVCICASCRLVEKHRRHKMQSLDQASVKKQKKMENVLQKLIRRREKTGKRVRSLKKRMGKPRKKADEEAKRVTALFIETRRRLDHLEKRLFSEISSQEREESLSLSNLIQNLEIKKNKLSRKKRRIEDLRYQTDPLTVLQDPDTGDLSDPEEGGGDKTHDVDVDVITGMLHAGFSDIMTYLHTTSPSNVMRSQPYSVQSLPSHTQASATALSGIEYGGRTVAVVAGVTAAGQGGIYWQGPADISLDVNTAGNYLLISDDLRTATPTKKKQKRPKTAERFSGYQVMSRQGFSSGRHYWDVEVKRSWSWIVGMCYPSIDRRGDQSHIGHNNKSWCLWGGEGYNNECLVIHDSREFPLPHQITSNRFRIYLDYEAGQLSFYELVYHNRHLHTFTTTFTELLHAVLYVCDGSVKILGGGAAVRRH